jgi:signal transduction histidine kinase
MTIRRYLSLILGMATACLLIGNAVVSYGVIRPHFSRLETEEALRDNMRAVTAVVSELHQMQLLVDDWAIWDDSYRFVSGVGVPDYVASNLTPHAFRILEVDLMVFFDKDGNVWWSGALDGPSGRIVPLAGDDLRAIREAVCPAPGGCGLSHGSGLLDVPGHVAFAAASSILTSLGQGPAVGIAVFARILDDRKARRLDERAQIRTSVRPAPPGSVPPPPEAGSGDRTAVVMEGEVTTVRTLLPGLGGSAVFLVETGSPRRISALGNRVATSALVASLLVLVVVGAVATWLIESRVVAPAHRLARKVSAVRGGDPPDTGANEFDVIDTEFDRTLSALRESEKKTVELNYYAGMAEMFAGMAHNLRNTLMPMSLNLWRLRSHVVRPGRGADGPEIERLLDLIEEQVMDLDQTLQDHHAFSKYGRQLVPTCPRSVVEDAVGTFMGTDRSRVALRVDPGLDRVPEVQAHPVILKQVIGNLIVNAREAIMMSSKGHGEIVIVAGTVDVDGVRCVRISVGDDGVGIAPETMRRLFERGYSTKRPSSGGIGLHWCVNVVSAMDGSLQAESAGPGCGATFTVTLRAV